MQTPPGNSVRGERSPERTSHGIDVVPQQSARQLPSLLAPEHVPPQLGSTLHPEQAPQSHKLLTDYLKERPPGSSIDKHFPYTDFANALYQDAEYNKWAFIYQTLQAMNPLTIAHAPGENPIPAENLETPRPAGGLGSQDHNLWQEPAIPQDSALPSVAPTGHSVSVPKE